jgi:hypothetical protein
MTKKEKNGRNRKESILVVSIILTVIFVSLLISFSFQFANNQKFNPFHESAGPYYFTFRPNDTGPNYFFPYASLDFAVANKYIDEISGFHFFLSFDNSSWVEISLTKPLNIPPDFPPEPNYILTHVGIISLNGFSNVLYAKCVFPLQGFNETTQTRIINSFEGYLYISPCWTPYSIAAIILLSVALLSFIIQILDFCFKDGSAKSNLSENQKSITDFS